jgi:predicted Na+-dependent transporter
MALPPHISAGILLIAACPVGDIANFYTLLAGLAFGRLLRLWKGDGVTVGIGFAVRNVALAMAIAVTILNRIEYAVFAVVYFLTEVPLLLGAVTVYRMWRTQAVHL